MCLLLFDWEWAKTYQADQLPSALQQIETDTTIVVEITQETAKHNELATTIEANLSIDIDKVLSLDINESILKDEDGKLPENVDAEKLMDAEELSLPAEDNLSVDKEHSDKETKRLDNDEANILHHADKQKIKEKEYGD